jgi:hypothetical protein
MTPTLTCLEYGGKIGLVLSVAWVSNCLSNGTDGVTSWQQERRASHTVFGLLRWHMYAHHLLAANLVEKH